MNEDLNYEPGLSKNAKIVIGVAVSVVVVGLIVGAALLLRSRARGPQTEPVQQQDDTGAVNAPVSETRPLTPEELFAQARERDLKAIAEYNQSHPYVTDPKEYANVQYDVEQSLTAEELEQMGFPPDSDIRYKYVRPNKEEPNQEPIKVFTKFPPSAQVPYPTPAPKAAAPATP